MAANHGHAPTGGLAQAAVPQPAATAVIFDTSTWQVRLSTLNSVGYARRLTKRGAREKDATREK